MQAEALRCALVITAQSQTGALDPGIKAYRCELKASADGIDLKLLPERNRNDRL